MAAVEVDGLVVRYGEVTAVDGVSFEAEAGQITAVLGPNGAGKTTTIEALDSRSSRSSCPRCSSSPWGRCSPR